jgi:predicted porin
MDRLSLRAQLCAGVALACFIVGASSTAKAQTDEAALKAMQAKIEELTRTVKKLEAAQATSNANALAAKKQADQAKVVATEASAKAVVAKVPNKADDWDVYFRHKPGKNLTFKTPNGEITAYGNFDVSLDATSKNVGTLVLNGSSPPVGNFGWMPALSTNNSYLGVRGFQRLGDLPWNFVYQFEVGIDITATPGLKQSNSNLSNYVNGALFNRNTYIGFASPAWGAIKVGKTDAPYKNSTADFNPFSGEIGDYAAIMGNSGGDNRVEFGTRIDHAIWYESPMFAGGFKFNLLFAPGQNRADNSDNLATGESDCAGGNDPTSGGNPFISCSDGAFSNVVSTNLSYTKGPLYMTAAYEFHQKVNRQSDLAGAYGVPVTLGTQNCSNMPTPTAMQLCLQDVANEDAAKVGVMYKFETHTTVGAIFERLHRYVPADLMFQNERTRNGSWLVVSQDLNPVDSLHFGWGHAFKSPGNPGQHNDSTLVTPDGASFGPNQNQADLLTVAYKHKITPDLVWYTALAATINGPDAHYDLGAGGRSNTTDCHDANSAPGGLTANPHCYTGATLMGISTGVQWKF